METKERRGSGPAVGRRLRSWRRLGAGRRRGRGGRRRPARDARRRTTLGGRRPAGVRTGAGGGDRDDRRGEDDPCPPWHPSTVRTTAKSAAHGLGRQRAQADGKLLDAVDEGQLGEPEVRGVARHLRGRGSAGRDRPGRSAAPSGPAPRRCSGASRGRRPRSRRRPSSGRSAPGRRAVPDHAPHRSGRPRRCRPPGPACRRPRRRGGRSGGRPAAPGRRSAAARRRPGPPRPGRRAGASPTRRGSG